MDIIEKTIKSEKIYDGKILSLKLDTVLLPNGNTSMREEVEHLGGACVLAVVDDNIAFVSQYRYAYNCEILEIPAGKLEVGENPEVCAKRELLEEVGLIASSLKKIAEIKPSPGYTNEIIYCYYAEGITKGNQKLDDDEFLNVSFINIEKAFEMVDNGEITDAKTLIALLFLKTQLQKEKLITK